MPVFDLTEKRKQFTEELHVISSKVVERFIAWAFDCQTDPGLLVALRNLRDEFLKVFKQKEEGEG